MARIKGSKKQNLGKQKAVSADGSLGKRKSAPADDTPKKRVRFAEELEKVKLFGKKDIIGNVEDDEVTPAPVTPVADEADGEVEAKPDVPKRKVVKSDGFKKPKVQVTRKVKEALKTMDRKERKAFLLKLKSKKRPHFQSAQDSKTLWEKIRSSKTTEAVREKSLAKLADVVKGKCATLLYAHDTSRVLQCLLDKPEYREQLFDELSPELLRMMRSKYAKFFFNKLLRLANKVQRDVIINAVSGHCVKLLRNAIAAQALETIFNDYATATQRFAIASEFYGNDFLLYRGEVGTEDIAEIFQKYPNKKKAILDNIRETLDVVVDKEAVKYTLTHRLLREYIDHCTTDDRDTLFASIIERVPEILHTPDGAIVSMQCVWNGTAKDRKTIVKNFKGCVVAACKERFGHRVLLTIFDSVDDTVLVNKHIISEIGNNIGEIAEDKFGQKVLHYLVNPRNETYFLKAFVGLLEKGDGNAHSKKAPADRYSELFAGIVEPLMVYMAANMRDLLYNSLTVDLVRCTLEKSGPKDLFQRQIPKELRASCYEAIKTIAEEEFIPMNSDHYHVVEDMFTHLTLTRIIRSDPEHEVKLSDYLADLPTEQLKSFIGCQKGCFVLVAMIEHGGPKAQKAVKDAIKPSLLSKYKNKGAAVLLKKLS